MIHTWIRITYYGCLVLLLAACNSAGASTLPDETVAQPATLPSAAATQAESEMTQPTPLSGRENLIELAKENLAQRLSIPVNQINLMEAETVAWPDTGLGCPQTDISYAQVVTPGYRILFEARGLVYAYHTDSNKQLVLCENSVVPVIPVKPGEIDDGQPWMPN